MQKTAWIMSLLCQFGIKASRFIALGLNKNIEYCLLLSNKFITLASE